MGRRLWHVAAALGLALALPLGTLTAQATRSAGSPAGAGLLPEWLETWSPLSSLVDLPRDPPGTSSPLPAVLDGPAPRVGAFWNTGNPGALPLDVRDRTSVFAAGQADVSGDYRRPFDPGRQTLRRAAALGWRPIDRAGAGIGRVVVESAKLDDGVFSNIIRPYSSSPYAVADTSGTGLRRLAARVEGAAGWAFGGGFGLGLGLAFEAQETRTAASPVPRRNRSAGPAASAGVTREFLDGGLLIGAYGRWHALNETARVYTVAASTRIYEIDGYEEAVPRDVSALYNRRLERTALAGGLNLGGHAWGVEWTAWFQRGRADEDQYNERQDDPRVDRWMATTITVGLGLSRELAGGAVLTSTMGWIGLDGEAVPAPGPVEPGEDEDPVVFRADESAVRVLTDLRLPLGGSAWELAGRLRFDREHRVRRDERVSVESRLDLRTFGLGVGVLWSVRGDLVFSASGGFGSFSPSGGIPLPAAMGPVYQRWIAPEMSMLGTPVSNRVWSLGVRWDGQPSTSVWARVGGGAISRRDGELVLPELPMGDRRATNLAVGVTLRD